MFKPGPNLWFYRHPSEGWGEPVLVTRMGDGLVMQRTQFRYEFETQSYVAYSCSEAESVDPSNLLKVMETADCPPGTEVEVAHWHTHAFGLKGIVRNTSFHSAVELEVVEPGRSDFSAGDLCGFYVWHLQPTRCDWPRYDGGTRRPQQLPLFT